MYTQPTISAAGGVAIYVNNKLDHFERKDLSILHQDFESIWVEMKNKRGKNFLCGCIYRHPNTDISHFIEYMEATLFKINKNKHNVFLMGDFNIDSLQYESHSYTNYKNLIVTLILSFHSLLYHIFINLPELQTTLQQSLTTYFQTLLISKL